MFDYQRLQSYQKARNFNYEIRNQIKTRTIDPIVSDQLKRASLSILLNIAEGAGRYTHPDKKNFYIIARASVFEVSVLLELLHEEKVFNEEEFKSFDLKLEAMSIMLFKLIQVYTKK